jgi:hypothetical protein
LNKNAAVPARPRTGERISISSIPQGALYLHVKVARKGRRINISEEYGTPAFDAAYEAAVATLGGRSHLSRFQLVT